MLMAAARLRDRVRVPEIVLVTLTEQLGISRWHLLHVMTE